MKNAIAAVISLAIISSATGLLSEYAPKMVIASNKTYRDFASFYPFYLSQHSDEICRRLHFFGTTTVLMLSMLDFGVITSFLCASAVGVVACPLTCSLPHGIIEALLMVLMFYIVFPHLSVTNNQRAYLMWLLPLVGYGFAWVGHFFFENNRPATFIYPAYSLFGDFKMWFEICTGVRAF